MVEILTAFSRLQDSPKVYVQDRLREHGQHIWQMLEDGATIYVCGDAAGMAAENRYLLDVWASG